MKRDWHILRAILLNAEEGVSDRTLSINEDLLQGHIAMAYSAGFLSGEIEPSLTWSGHEFLDAVRDDAVWAVCYRAIAWNCGGLPSDLILEIARDASEKKRLSSGPQGL